MKRPERNTLIVSLISRAERARAGTFFAPFPGIHGI